MLVRYLLSSRVRPPSVRPFVTSRCTTKTTKSRILETPPQDSPETSVLRRKRSLRNSDGTIPNGGAKLRLLTGREVFGSDLPPKVCVHPTVVLVHDGAVVEKDAVSSSTLMIVTL